MMVENIESMDTSSSKPILIESGSEDEDMVTDEPVQKKSKQ